MGSRERSIGNILTKYAHGSSQNMASSRGFFKNWDVNYELKGGQNKREHCRKMNRETDGRPIGSCASDGTIDRSDGSKAKKEIHISE